MMVVWQQTVQMVDMMGTTYFLRIGAVLILCALVSGKIRADATLPSSRSYGQSLQAWKAQVRKLQGIRDRLAVTKGDDLATLKKDYLQAVADAKPALRHFTTAAESALKKGDEHQQEAADFLKQRMKGLIDADDYERAFRIGTFLVKNGHDNQVTLESTGIAAAMINHFQQFLHQCLLG